MSSSGKSRIILMVIFDLMFIMLMVCLSAGISNAEAMFPSPGPDNKVVLLPAERIELSTEKSMTDSSGTRAPCHIQRFYGDTETLYYWPMPYNPYEITEYAVRFNTCDAETLKTISFAVFDPEDGTFGNDDIIVKIFGDNGFGLPDLSNNIGSFTIPPGVYNAYPAMTSLDVSAYALVLLGNFHVSLSSSGASGEYESILSDDGMVGSKRSSILMNGQWYSGQDIIPYDVNFIIEVEMCLSCYKSAAASDYIQTSPNGEPPVLSTNNIPSHTMAYRLLTLDSVWFKHNGDGVGKSEVFAYGSVGPYAFGGTGFPNYVQNWQEGDVPNDRLKIKEARRHGKKKCVSDFCTSDFHEKCHYYPMGKRIYEELAPSGFFVGDDADFTVDVHTAFKDYNKPSKEYIEAGAALIKAFLKCYALFADIGGASLDDCAKAITDAAEAFKKLDEVSYTHKPRTIGKHEVLIDITKTCWEFALDYTIGGHEARIKYSWYTKQLTNKGNSYPDKLISQIGDSVSIDELSHYSYARINGNQLKCRTWVNGTSLLNADPSIWGSPGTREFIFAIDGDMNPATGCTEGYPLCGADCIISVLQKLENNSLAVYDTIYCWDETCCPLGPRWVASTEKPYDLFVGNMWVEIKAKLEDVGVTSSDMASWVVLKKNGITMSTAPDDVCNKRLPTEYVPDIICPSVVNSFYLPDDDRYQIIFDEPMLIQPSDVTLIPSINFTVSFDETGRILYIDPVSFFPAGIYEVQLAATVTDLATPGNGLDNDFDDVCGDSFFDIFCVEDKDFIPSDASGNFCDLFGSGDPIYVSGTGFPSGSYYLYLVMPENIEFEGSKFIDQSTDGKNPASGPSLTGFNIGSALRDDEYCAVADLNSDGIYQYSDRVVGLCDIGFLVGDPCENTLNCMVFWLPFDEAQDAEASVDIMEANNAIHHGTPTAVSGEVRGALSFDGIDDYVEVPDDELLDITELLDETGDFSIDFWIMTTDATGVSVLLDKRESFPNIRGYSLYLYNGSLGCQMADGVGTPAYTNFTSSASVATGFWTHAAVTVDRDKVDGGKFYVNGALAYTFNPTSENGSLENDAPLRIGCESFSLVDFFSGNLDELSLYACVLTPEEVNAIYTVGSLGKCCNDSTVDLCSCFVAGSCGSVCDCRPGEARNDSLYNILDITYLISYLYKGGLQPAPYLICSGDANCNCVVNILDITFLINYIYRSGLPPCTCENWLNNCGAPLHK